MAYSWLSIWRVARVHLVGATAALTAAFMLASVPALALASGKADEARTAPGTIIVNDAFDLLG